MIKQKRQMAKKLPRKEKKCFTRLLYANKEIGEIFFP